MDIILRNDWMNRVQILDKAVFHCMPMPLRKTLILLFSFQLWFNNKADWALLLWYRNQCERRKEEFTLLLLHWLLYQI